MTKKQILNSRNYIIFNREIDDMYWFCRERSKSKYLRSGKCKLNEHYIIYNKVQDEYVLFKKEIVHFNMLDDMVNKRYFSNYVINSLRELLVEERMKEVIDL